MMTTRRAVPYGTWPRRGTYPARLLTLDDRRPWTTGPPDRAGPGAVNEKHSGRAAKDKQRRFRKTDVSPWRRVSQRAMIRNE